MTDVLRTTRDASSQAARRQLPARNVPTSFMSIIIPVAYVGSDLLACAQHHEASMTIELPSQPLPSTNDGGPFAPPPVEHLANVVYLVGHPIAHSSSPKLHEAISSSSGIPYAQILVETTDLPSFMRYLRDAPADNSSKPKVLGSGVTMPHKVSVLAHLGPGRLTPEAKAIGAVNTVFQRDGEWWGTNTDTVGIREAITLNLSAEVLGRGAGRPGMVVGGGGTCRTAIYTLQRLGCSKIYIVNRDPSEVEGVLASYTHRRGSIVHIASEEDARELEPPALVVSAVPDYTPSSTSEWAVRDILRLLLRRGKAGGTDAALLEMCYHPSPRTQITHLAEECGWKVIGGIEAMIAQGLEQARLWTGVEVDEELRRRAREAVRPKA